jgi:hypothetical protein
MGTLIFGIGVVVALANLWVQRKRAPRPVRVSAIEARPARA